MVMSCLMTIGMVCRCCDATRVRCAVRRVTMGVRCPDSGAQVMRQVMMRCNGMRRLMIGCRDGAVAGQVSGARCVRCAGDDAMVSCDDG